MYDIKINSFSFSSHKNIVIDSIEGLGPPSVTISTLKAGKSGENFSGSTIDKRNIVINFSLLYDVKNIRELMCQEIPIDEKITLTIETKKITGYIENFVINNFQVLTTGQISIICPDPYFYLVNPKTLNLSSSSQSITPNVKDYILTVEYAKSSGAFVVSYTNFSYTISGNYVNENGGFVMINNSPIISNTFFSGDILIIDTLNKKVTLNGRSIYGKKSWTDLWPTLNVGVTQQLRITTNFAGTAKLECIERFLYV